MQAAYNKVSPKEEAMPNEVMWMDPSRGGMGWTNLWDEISIDRIVTWIKHANSDGVESRIASAAVHRSEGLDKTGRPILEGESVRPWDGTMLGRITESDDQRRR
jgi:hypothetical protein